MCVIMMAAKASTSGRPSPIAWAVFRYLGGKDRRKELIFESKTLILGSLVYLLYGQS